MTPSVALVFPTYIKQNAFHGMLLPALGLERLGAAVEDVANVELFDIRFEPHLIDELIRFNPQFVALNVKTTMYANHSYEIGKAIRKALPATTIITGGLHATACPGESLEFADVVIRGEGELAFRDLVSGKENKNIPNIVFKENNKIHYGETSEPVKDLDELRPPARHLRKPHYNYSSSGVIKMDILETSRGCTHACIFCSGGSLYPNNYRAHSPEYVFKEIERLAKMGVKWCMLSDDHFGNHSRVNKICDLIIESSIKMAFFVFIRPFVGQFELKQKMVKAGFVMVSYGAESPDVDQVKRYGKGYENPEQFIYNSNKEWLEAGAVYVGNSYVFGDINDSVETLKGIGSYSRKLNPTYIEPLYAQPYPGTPYRRDLESRGLLLKDKSWDLFTEGRLLIKHPQADEKLLKQIRMETWLNFISPKKIAMQLKPFVYFVSTLEISKKAVLKVIKGSEYTLLGCYIEDKFYDDCYYGMVDTYFRETIKTFEPLEMEMDALIINSFCEILGLNPVKKFLGDGEMIIKVTEGRQTMASFIFQVQKGDVVVGKAIAAYYEPHQLNISVKLPLSLIKHRFASKKTFVKEIATFGMILINIVPVITHCFSICLRKHLLRLK